MDACGAFLARRQWLWFLFAQEVLFLAEAVLAAASAVVGGCRGGRTEEERSLFDAFCEEGFGCVGGVGAAEEGVGDVWSRRHVSFYHSFW